MSLTLHVDGEIFSRQPHGGISRVFLELFKAFRKRDDVAVHLYLDPKVDPLPFRNMISQVHALPSLSPYRAERWLGGLYRPYRTARRRRAWSNIGEGVFISTYYTHPDGLARPALLLVQDMIYEEYPEYFNAAKDHQHVRDKAHAAARAAAFCAPSCSAMNGAMRYYGIGQKPAKVIPYAVAADFFSVPGGETKKSIRERYTGGREYILFSGARGGHKNFNGLLNAFAAGAWGDRIHLLAAGGGAPSPVEAALMHALGVHGRIHFAGSLPEDELVRVFHAARAVVVPSFCEGYGFPLIEAMAAGRPVASSTGGSLPEVGQDAPVYFDPREPESMVRALRLIVDLDDRDSRIQRGLAIAHARTWDDVAMDFLSVALRICHDL